MSQAESPNTPKSNKSSCIGAGAFLVLTFFGFGALIIVMTLIGGYLWNQNRTEKVPEMQAPEVEQPMDELPPEEGGSGEENPIPALEQESASPGEVDISDIAGTYIGTTNFLDFHIEDWGGGAITQNEITITISEDGIVGGTFIVRFESSEKSNESCVWHVFRTQSGTISGQISQSVGTIKFDYTSKQELFRNCLGGNATTVNDFHDEFHITISGNTMMGSGDGSKTFEATKQ